MKFARAILITTMIGTLSSMPIIPQILAPINKAIMAAKGLMFTLEPIIFGVMKLPSRN